MSELVFDRIFNIFNQFPRIYALTPAAARSRKLIQILHDFTDSVIRNRRTQLEKEGLQYNNNAGNEDSFEMYGAKAKLSFLDMLLHATVDSKPLSDLDIREEVDTFMFEVIFFCQKKILSAKLFFPLCRDTIQQLLQ